MIPDLMMTIFAFIYLTLSFKASRKLRSLKKKEKSLEPSYKIEIKFKDGTDSKMFKDFDNISIDQGGLYVSMPDDQEYYFEWGLLEHKSLTAKVEEKNG